MSLDIYVMPLWRFKVGDFSSPIENAFGTSPTIVTGEGVAEKSPRMSLLRKWQAKRKVRSIRNAVEAVNRTRIRWRDHGDVVYSEQSPGIEPLRAYAIWLEWQEEFPKFEPPPDNSFYNHPVMKLNRTTSSFPHLVLHDCYNGYHLPCEFENLVRVEPYMIFGTWPAKRSVGSSIKLARELETINQHLNVPEEYEYDQADSLVAVKYAFWQLRKVCELSIRHKLPIIFYG